MSPRRGDVGIVGLVPDAWDSPWMPRHHVLSRLARHFRVAWVEPRPHWRRALRAPRPLGDVHVDPATGLVLYGRGMPAFHRPAWLARLAFRARVRGAARLLRRQGARRLVLYLWRPAFDAAVGALDWDLVCYHIDDEYTFSADDGPVPERERRLLAAADQVFIHSPGLMEKKGDINPNTALVPNGVDFAAFAEPGPEPADLIPIPRPRIGYTGMLKRQLDWELMLELAERHEGWSFVFVGGRSPHPELDAILDRMARLPNVHFLGEKSAEELGRYPQHFDVCVMPYRVDGYTRYIYPMKLHEYLASGRPVVGAPIRTLREFAYEVKLVETPYEWSAALASCLEPEAMAPQAAEARRTVAREHDWERLVERIAALIEDRLLWPEAGPCGQAEPAEGTA